MKAFKHKVLFSAIAFAAMCAVGTARAGAAANSSLVTAQQQALDRQALPLLGDPVIKAARDAALRQWDGLRAATLADGKATLSDDIDEMVYHALRAAVADDPTQPKVVWTLGPDYSIGQSKVPGSRFAGDNPDRIYRYAAVDPAAHYEIHGQRGARPAQHEFSFEATSAISLVAPALVALYSKDVDVAADGSFVVSADSTPADGRRNHLQLPAGAKAILFRDTLPDWSMDYNQLTITRLEDDNGAKAAARSREQITSDAAAIIADAATGSVKFFDAVWHYPANEIKPFVRSNEWGVPGNVISFNRFNLQKDEALVITLLPSGANYLGVQITDPWGRSVDYRRRTSSLSDHQAKPNGDGSITYVLSAKDPGVLNWLDNGGLIDGLILGRWEMFPQPLPPGNADQLVREVRKVKLRELAAALPTGTVKISSGQRKRQLKVRATEYARRVALK